MKAGAQEEEAAVLVVVVGSWGGHVLKIHLRVRSKEESGSRGEVFRRFLPLVLTHLNMSRV